MLRSLDALLDYEIHATDGMIGAVRDFYVDTRDWFVRYMVADMGGLLTSRHVLLTPESFGSPDWLSSTFPIRHTQEEIRNSPDADVALPLSRPHERTLHDYFRWVPYWTPEAPVYPYIPAETRSPTESLNSYRELLGLDVQATDGNAGTATDIIVEDKHWRMQLLVVDTGSWMSAKQVLLVRDHVVALDVVERRIRVDLDTQGVEAAPEFDPNEPVNQEHEVRLYDYYGRPQSRL